MELTVYLLIILFFVAKFMFIGWLILIGLRVLGAILGGSPPLRDNNVNITITVAPQESPRAIRERLKTQERPDPIKPPPELPRLDRLEPPTIDHVSYKPRRWLTR